MTVLAVIPARLESTRLPRKLLLDETGWPLLRHTWAAARRVRAFDDVVVATDSTEIATIVAGWGGTVVETGPCASGTDRVAEAVRRLGWRGELVVNVQGDEPEIVPDSLERLVSHLLDSDTPADVATLAAPARGEADLVDPALVKVVVAADGRALYFSRAPIPFDRDGVGEFGPEGPWWIHTGIYAFRSGFLESLGTDRSPLEQVESLEQLRWLESGSRIDVVRVEAASPGVDTPADYSAFVRRATNSASPPGERGHRDTSGRKVTTIRHVGRRPRFDHHRSGWPEVRNDLATLEGNAGIAFDDFAEASFSHPEARFEGYREPWIGVFHLPPTAPSWLVGERVPWHRTSEAWDRSLDSLVGAVALTEFAAERMQDRLAVPVRAIRHPTAAAPTFDPERFLDDPRIVQVGFFLRNVVAIEQVSAPSWIRRMVLRSQHRAFRRARRRLLQQPVYGNRVRHAGVEVLDRLSDTDYDDLLTRCLVLAEYVDASASNTVVECLARATPMLVNRHPAVVEYLGSEYPLYFDDLDDVSDLLTRPRILAAHDFLLARDRSFLDPAVFREDVRSFVSKVAGAEKGSPVHPDGRGRHDA